MCKALKSRDTRGALCTIKSESECIKPANWLYTCTLTLTLAAFNWLHGSIPGYIDKEGVIIHNVTCVSLLLSALHIQSYRRRGVYIYVLHIFKDS